MKTIVIFLILFAWHSRADHVLCLGSAAAPKQIFFFFLRKRRHDFLYKWRTSHPNQLLEGSSTPEKKTDARIVHQPKFLVLDAQIHLRKALRQKHFIKWCKLTGNEDEEIKSALKIPPDDFNKSSANAWSRSADKIKTCATATLEITQYGRT